MFNKTKKNKNKKYFCKYYLQCFRNERVLVEHKEICLKINRNQTVKLKSSFVDLKIIPDKYHLHLKLMPILSVL